MVQDIYPHHFDNSFASAKAPQPQSPVFVFRGRDLLCRDPEEGAFPSLPIVSGLFPGLPEGTDECRLTYIFTVDETPCFLCLEEMSRIPEGYSFHNIRDVRAFFPGRNDTLLSVFTALHLDNWYRHNRFCGCCGEKMHPGKDERRMDCPKCGNQVYPRINPAVIVGVTNGDELLITWYARTRGVSYPALVAGFTEIGESFEETVRREVMEEVGLKVRNIRYYKSQPWGLADDILAGYYCDVDGDPAIRLDRNELKTAAWTRREEITGQPDDLSLTNEMMMVFRAGKEPKACPKPLC